MSNIIGQETLSFSKTQVAESSKESVKGVRRLVFAHKFVGGETGFDLAALTIPSELASNGFINPSPAELLSANLNVYRRNLRMHSSRAGRIFDHDAYVLTGTRVNFLPAYGTALPGEIIMGEVDFVPISYPVVGDARFVSHTYNLPQGQTTLNLGEIYKVGVNVASDQIGALRVRRNGLSQLRNVANATASITADGNYQEIDSDNGFGTTIQFNVPPTSAAGDVIEVDFGLHVAQADMNVFGSIEMLHGAVQKIAEDAAQGFYGDTNSARYLASSPSVVERRAFGDKVLSLESRLSSLEQNTYVSQMSDWKSSGIADGQWPVLSNNFIDVPPGVWELGGQISFDNNGTAPDYFSLFGRFSTANGNNESGSSGANPTLVQTITPVPSGTTNHFDHQSGSSSSIIAKLRIVATMPNIIISGSQRVFLNTQVQCVTVAQARIRVALWARKIGN